MGKIAEFFGNPGDRTDVHQQVRIDTSYAVDEVLQKPGADSGDLVEVLSSSSSESVRLGELEVEENGEISTSIGFTGLVKNRTDRVLDRLVQAAGSQVTFIFLMIVLLGWAIAGIVSGAPNQWQVAMQDGQSIQCYVWDTLLMRQQLMSAHEHMCICAELGSRVTVLKKLLTRVADETEENQTIAYEHLPEINEVTVDLQDKTWYDKFASVVSKVLGSWYTIIIYWCGIFVWVGCGALNLDAGNSPPYTGKTSGSNPELAKFSNLWQMYINTATAVVLYTTSVFLQNIRARHDIFVAKYIRELFAADVKIDNILRRYNDDYTTEADIVTVKAGKRTKGEVWIDWYGDIIGTGAGVIIGVLVFAAWIAIGDPMKWSDNWWLIIGTYTGLVGFLDGFVIRQNYFRIVQHETQNYENLIADDYELFSLLGIECPERLMRVPIEKNRSITYRVSAYVNRKCSTELSVLASIILIIVLICIASALRWNETGQLLVNTPTMIIEGFFLLILLQSHNWADVTRRAEIALLCNRRIFLMAYLENRFGTDTSETATKYD
ncbi:unnamed protein product [Kluyveromyces dobzhanskii CBS 2104]|uniref:WGS project CCBQ000000000 data, contig 00079 n=1 Tax=Kluyveromyces dobzhanskii CBS 2104 TaxID=1427455 RepID=A0A0A8LCG6_9SACH|nr:unnamed protein product [Kluyveromyces dobzhanskii CBS 2104]